MEYILTKTIDRVAVIHLNRPKAYNALNPQLMQEVMLLSTNVRRTGKGSDLIIYKEIQ